MKQRIGIALAQAWGWLRQRKLELGVFALGVALRITMSISYSVGWGYDFIWHWELVEWMIQHRRVAEVEALFQAQHPPLHYTVAALLHAGGASVHRLVWLPITCGTIRLGLIWAGLELYLPHSRWARVTGLLLAATTAASVHIDGMVYPEAMSGMWNAAAMLLTPLVFRSAGRKRWRYAIALGAVLGLGMLTKISAVAVIASVGLATLLELVFSAGNWRERLGRALPLAGTLALCLALCGWYYARNVRDYGRPFVTSFDLKSQEAHVAPWKGVPYFKRRPLRFFVGWEPAMYAWPYKPVATAENPTFFPAVVASTFVDYWAYGFSGLDPFPPTGGQNHPGFFTPEPLLGASRGSVLGGTLIFFATVCAWFGAAWHTLARKDWGRVALVAVPAIATASAVHFAVRYPVDYYGVVKGVYLQFAAPPMCALFGVAVAWSAARRVRWPALAALLVGLWLIASYTLYCRMRVPVVPLPSWPRSGNLAVGASVSASPSAFGTQPSGAVDGERFGQLGYHSDLVDAPTLTIDLGAEREVARLEVYGRTDCCFEQSVPLIAETSLDGKKWKSVSTRTKGFSGLDPWKLEFPPHSAHFVRLRSRGKKYLVIAEAEVYGPAR